VKNEQDEINAGLLGAALRSIRLARRMRTSELARELGMPLRTYEHLEAGRGRITYDKIVRFAEVTNSDPVAILLTLPLKSHEFAVRCADNKLATILTIALGELNDELGDDIEFLEAGTLIGAFTRVAKDLKNHVANRDLFAETWLKENSSKVDGARHTLKRRWRFKP
jgi:transcriptional regulator with XRE-family HTH domain